MSEMDAAAFEKFSVGLEARGRCQVLTTCHMGGDVFTEVPAWGDVGLETSWVHLASLFS